VISMSVIAPSRELWMPWQQRRSGPWWRLPFRNPLAAFAKHLQWNSGSGHLLKTGSAGNWHLATSCGTTSPCDICDPPNVPTVVATVAGITWPTGCQLCGIAHRKFSGTPNGTFDVPFAPEFLICRWIYSDSSALALLVTDHALADCSDASLGAVVQGIRIDIAASTGGTEDWHVEISDTLSGFGLFNGTTSKALGTGCSSPIVVNNTITSTANPCSPFGGNGTVTLTI
jgi:hypothetical protein